MQLASWETLLLEIASRVSSIQAHLGDDAIERVARVLVDEWHGTHGQREADALAAEAKGLVGEAAWGFLAEPSRKDVLAFILLDNGPDREKCVGLRILAACIAFERELRAALTRVGTPENEVQVAMESLLRLATQPNAMERLRDVASRALAAEVPRLRNLAAHGRSVTHDHLKEVEEVLFARDGRHGLIGLAATCAQH